jgi:hypothetical protein
MARSIGIPLRGQQTYSTHTLQQLMRFPNTTTYWFIISGMRLLPALTRLTPCRLSRLRHVISKPICQFIVPVLRIALMLAFILENPSHCLHSLVMLQLMAMPRGLFRLPTTSRVILPILPSISSVSTISRCPVIKSVKITFPNLSTVGFVEFRPSLLLTLPRRVLLRVTMWLRISANMDAIPRIPALGQTLLHCLALMPLPSGPVALPFHTSPQPVMLANLA